MGSFLKTAAGGDAASDAIYNIESAEIHEQGMQSCEHALGEQNAEVETENDEVNNTTQAERPCKLYQSNCILSMQAHARMAHLYGETRRQPADESAASVMLERA